MVELAIVGAKNSGKTTVMEGLVAYLVGRGFRVATIKHTAHSHRFDTPGKDTFRHRDAGAALTVARGEGETAIFAQPHVLDIQSFQELMHDRIDIWLIEGDRQADYPKILVTRDPEGMSDDVPRNIVATIGPRRLDGVPMHFEMEDYSGLGSYVAEAITRQRAERPA
jgi:molybdopterin-guanine dinucleotide biosynthesis protein MobB